MQKKLNTKKNLEKGFVFTLEATIAILAFAIMLISLQSPQNDSLKELAALQQANDLLRVWSATETSENEMRNDANLIFGKRAEIWANEKQILFANRQGNSIATQGIIITNGTAEEKVRLVVYYN